MFKIIIIFLAIFIVKIDFSFGNKEMDEFIDECNKMVDTVNTCVEGWVDLENEIINSVDSFSDRILFTENLIEEEADQILVMAGRIVETEGYMIDVIESCDCNSNTLVESKVDTNRSLNEINPKIELLSLNARNSFSLLSNSSLQADRCAPMDQMLEVMDASLDAFLEFNNDFLEVLSYMDSAIQDMGDRILDTECLIMNMSYQIGAMADRIVIVEQMMFNATKTCCGTKNDVKSNFLRKNPVKFLVKPEIKYTDSNDDLLKDCGDFSLEIKPLNNDSLRAKKILKSNIKRLFVNLKFKFHQKIPSKSDIRLKGTDDGFMPCDTWWNPFCCAFEVCADIMADMIEMMANGADVMTQICEDIVDEIGNLADDIVTTEEDIILMGYKIGDMSDCIVVFIDEGIDFMTLYCPSASPYGLVRVHKTNLEAEVCSLEDSTMKSSKETIQQRLINLAKYTKLKIDNLDSNNLYKRVGDNPFGEFAAMVDAAMNVMNSMTELLKSQTDTLNNMLQTMVKTSELFANFMTSVSSMDSAVSSLGVEILNENKLMDSLIHCHD